MVFDPIREVLMQLSEDQNRIRRLLVIPLNGSEPYTMMLEDQNNVLDSRDLQMLFTHDYSRLVIRGDGNTNVYLLSALHSKKRPRIQD